MMKNLVLFSWILLLFTACETGTRYDTNTSNEEESAIVDSIEAEELDDPTHSESYYIDQGEDDYAEEIASANRVLSDVADRNIPEEINEPDEVDENVEVSSQHFEGGTITDGLNIKSIRKAEHDSYVRLVFDSDGVNNKAPKVGSYKVDYDPSKKRVAVVLNGYRAFTAKFPTFNDSGIVEKIDFAKYLDDSGYKFYINLRENTKIKVFALESPARLVIDVQKP
jgi:hypothetical protein